MAGVEPSTIYAWVSRDARLAERAGEELWALVKKKLVR